ncbi:hypothetical protein F5Y05DRAFT_408668 [Hypoxylon sp. FL0543]|nr:hypothetical protein F5Y05DRAFT_408668 [Hypoxylon sp. FL0543]
MDPGANTSPGTPTKVSNILDLPDEILKEICSQCLQCDWVCLSLVCRRFRDFAAAQLYRNFHIVFPDEDDPYFDSPIDGLAGGLSTFASSNYNYAQHLREISLDTLSVGDRAEAAYKPYLATVSCGKFMNTLFLLTLRNAQSLDTFQWNIRVELSRPVFKQLHSIKSLKHLHLRLQAGPSLYEAPPPLPYSSAQYPEYSGSTPVSQWLNFSSGTPDPATIYGGPPTLLSSSAALKPSWKSRVSKKSPVTKEPPTISGFRKLESLSVLDIDSHDIITEIKICVRNSSSTLRKLKLSFSDSFASQARKPSADAELDDSEDEGFQDVPLAGITATYNSAPAKVFRAQEERKAQESVLGRIFELEPFQAKNFLVPSVEEKEEESPDEPISSEGQHFIDRLNAHFRKMTARVNGTSDFTYLDQQNALDVITEAAKKYVKSEEAKSKVDSSTQDDRTADGMYSSSKEVEQGLAPGGDGDKTQASTSGTKERPAKAKDTAADMNPDDIDIAAPEEQLVVESQPAVDTIATDASPLKELEDAIVSSVPSGIPAKTVQAQLRNLRRLNRFFHKIEKYTDALAKEIQEAEKLSPEDAEDHLQKLSGCHKSLKDMRQTLKVMKAEFNDATTLPDPTANDKERLLQDANGYARATRGIGLRSLSIHLVPIKASVLGKAIDLHTLNRVTLLNVGEQKRFWVLMMKENKLKPLPLRKIYTDDVCLQFLQLVSELSCVEEVFMLQRSPNYKPESFAPNPGTTIEQIRKFVLRKHLHSLRRLMIKNQADSTWDVDEKTIQLICRRGKVLEELAVIMGMRAIHTFIQNIGGLINLRALQLISFRTEDTCLSVIRETRCFIVDAISQHRQLKLEWLALGDGERAVRIIRKTIEAPNVPKKTSTKGKEPATNTQTNYNVDAPFPMVPVESDASSESEDDNEDSIFPTNKLQVIEGFAFYDIYGIRIFKKEVANGRL